MNDLKLNEIPPSGDGSHFILDSKTGAPVLGMVYDNGVAIVGDSLVAYGVLVQNRSAVRIFKVNEKVIVGCGGYCLDIKFLRSEIEQQVIKDSENNKNYELTPRALYDWLTMFLNNRRSDMDCKYIDVLIAGINGEPDEKPFLGHISLYGKTYKGDVIATGYGSPIAWPLMRDFFAEKGENITNIKKEEAQSILQKCMQLLYSRDCRSFAYFSEGTVDRTVTDDKSTTTTATINTAKISDIWEDYKKKYSSC